METDRTFGINNPIEDSKHGNVFDMSRDSLSKFKSQLYTLLFTNPGERVMLPEFGWNRYDILFNPMSEDIGSTVETDIKTIVSRWIPEIKLYDVSVVLDPVENNTLNMTIKFGLKADPNVLDQINIEMSM